ncbi:MAG TPA: PKD domain-containing protein [bacterium]
MLRNHFTYVFAVFCFILITGCSGGGNPVVPGGSEDGSGLDPGLRGNSTSDWGNGHNLLALVDVQLDVDNREVQIIPKRTSLNHLNLIQLLPIYCKPISKCLNFVIQDVDFDNFTVTLDVVVNHPIPDAYTDVYDMRGIGIFKGIYDPGFTGGSVATQILNADGYTTHYDEGGAFDAGLNPYIAFNKDQPNRIFAHSTQSVETFYAEFPSFEPEDSSFSYALDATWSDPLAYDPGNLLTDPNQAEPYKVKILYIDPMADQFLAEATAVVEVYDWQGNPGGVEFEAPDLYGGGLEMHQVMGDGERFLYYLNIFNDDVPGTGSFPTLARGYDEFETQPDLINPGIDMELANYALGKDLPGLVLVYDPNVNQAPVASIVADELIIEAGYSVEFDASGSYDPEDGTVSSYIWDLDGDWLFDDGDTETVLHQYLTPGLYAANVMVTDMGGLTDILDDPIAISVVESTNFPPTASAFASNLSPNIGQQITLDASASTDPEDGKPISWDWDLDNDGKYDDKSGEVIQHTFLSAGTFFVDVQVKDTGGFSDTLNTKLEVVVDETGNMPPVAQASADKTESVVGEMVTFDGSTSFDPDGEIQTYEWDLNGDGLFNEGFSDHAQYIYWGPGVYDVDLRVTDAGSSTDTLDEKLHITVTGENNPPVAIASSDKFLAKVGETITFDGTDSFDPEEGELHVFEWDFDGDGLYNDGFFDITPYQYLETGVYEVDLRVCDTPGLCDTLNNPILIQIYEGDNTPPVAHAEASSTFGYEGDTITFDGSGSFDAEDGAPASWSWDLDGDGVFGDSPFIVADKTYNTASTYMVDLKVTDSEGLFDFLNEKIEVLIVPVGTNLPPDADGQINCTTPFTGQIVKFSDFSSDFDGTVVKWEWDFGEGDGWEDFTPTMGNTFHTYENQGVYNVDLRVTDDLDKTDTLDNKITVFVTLPEFTPPDTAPQCTVTKNFTYTISQPTPFANTSVDNRDLAYLPDGRYLMVAADSLYMVNPPADLNPNPLLFGAGWVRSIDSSGSNTIALSNLEDGSVKVYSVSSGETPTLTLVKDIQTGGPVDCVAFDDNDDLWVMTQGELRNYAKPTFVKNSCNTYIIPDIYSYGDPTDMAFNLWNRSFYVAVDDGAFGTVVEIGYLGVIQGSVSNVLGGPSNYFDILIDKNVVEGEEAGCRILVVGGISEALLTRLDADLNILIQSSYGYWGISGAALSPTTNEVVALEDCCSSWIDFLIPPADWSDIGG